MKTLKTIYSYLCIIICALAVLYGFIYWVMNPELTRMEVFLDTWWSLAIAIALNIPLLIKIKS